MQFCGSPLTSFRGLSEKSLAADKPAPCRRGMRWETLSNERIMVLKVRVGSRQNLSQSRPWLERKSLSLAEAILSIPLCKSNMAGRGRGLSNLPAWMTQPGGGGGGPSPSPAASAAPSSGPTSDPPRGPPASVSIDPVPRNLKIGTLWPTEHTIPSAAHPTSAPLN